VVWLVSNIGTNKKGTFATLQGNFPFSKNEKKGIEKNFH
jgi:hypothetical protein